jgi:hypothetical protein
MDPETTVREVFARVRVRDERVADLYAEHATISVGDDVHRGRTAILEFYRALFDGDPPHPVVDKVFTQGDLHIALLSVTRQSGGPARPVADAFTVVEGAITSLRICVEAQS